MKKKKIIYAYFSGERQLIVDYLYQHKQWEPVYFLGTDVDHNWAKNKYPNSIIADSAKIRTGEFDYSKIGEPVPIDDKIIDSLTKYESNCLANIEDSTNWNFSFFERKGYHHDMLKYWNTVINKLKPDVYILFSWPHTASCYTLYHLCKHYYSIDVVYLNPIPLFNLDLHITGTTMQSFDSQILDYYESNEKLTLSTDIKKYFDEVRSAEGRTPDYILSDFLIDKKENKLFRFKEFLRLIISTLFRGSGFKKARVAVKKNRKPYYRQDSKMNHFEYFLFVEYLRNKNKRLLKYYKPLCVEPDYNRKYLYFASSYQPEVVTNACVGHYNDLFLVLDILSSVLPDDWIIYYKENPFIFERGTRWKGALWRDKYYFEKVNSYKNIKLVSPYISAFKLIDNAQAVATAGGTTAWEAAARGKPALSFGNVWYSGCKSIFRIETLKDAQAALEKIINGYSPDRNDVERYAAAIDKIAFRGKELNANIPMMELGLVTEGEFKYKTEMEKVGKYLYENYEYYYNKKK